MPQPKGFDLSLSPPRRLMCDLLHFAGRFPTIPVQRRMHLAEVAAARNEASPRPSWCALFTKALAIVSNASPQLRRAYLSFPRPHLYQHPVNVATVAVERRFGDDDAVFFGHVCQPETLGLAELHYKVRRFKEHPIETIGSFRRCLRVSRLPGPVRRLLWWGALNVSGRKRAHFLGTFGVSAYGGLGASSLHPLTPLTTTLNYGVIDPDGSVDVRLIYDHRVLDGAPVARALGALERALKHEVLAELRYLRAVGAA
jgi:hypothetical protein